MDEAYAIGFVKRCEEAGVDPDELLKFAKMMAPAPTTAEKADFKAKVKGKTDPLAKLTSSGTKGKGSPIPKAQNLRREMLDD
jgi:hypothetical protein